MNLQFLQARFLVANLMISSWDRVFRKTRWDRVFRNQPRKDSLYDMSSDSIVNNFINLRKLCEYLDSAVEASLLAVDVVKKLKSLKSLYISRNFHLQNAFVNTTNRREINKSNQLPHERSMSALADLQPAMSMIPNSITQQVLALFLSRLGYLRCCLFVFCHFFQQVFILLLSYYPGTPHKHFACSASNHFQNTFQSVSLYLSYLFPPSVSRLSPRSRVLL